MTLKNKGNILGHIDLSTANDRVIAKDGKISGKVYLAGGDDLYKNEGGKAGKVFAGAGNDTLVAGEGKDRFVFDTALSAVTNVDSVTKFDPGKDKFYLDMSTFTALSGPGTLKGSEFHKGKHAGDANDHIIYNKAKGALYFDFDGDGAGGKVIFASVDKKLKLHADDFTVVA
ncbi:MAG: calcium-binding protein [Hyphomicrobiales bacterium]|nr:calcium-binding protein [Hyphomicrobiales bacterium]